MLFCKSAGALCSVAVWCHDREVEEIISSPEEQASCLASGNSFVVLFYTIITYACNIYRTFKVTLYWTWKTNVSPLQ